MRGRHWRFRSPDGQTFWRAAQSATTKRTLIQLAQFREMPIQVSEVVHDLTAARRVTGAWRTTGRIDGGHWWRLERRRDVPRSSVSARTPCRRTQGEIGSLSSATPTLSREPSLLPTKQREPAKGSALDRSSTSIAALVLANVCCTASTRRYAAERRGLSGLGTPTSDTSRHTA